MTLPAPPQALMTTRPGRVDFNWSEGIHISIRRLHVHSDGRTTGHVMVRSEAPNPAGLLHRGDLNLAATRSKKELAKALFQALSIWDWGLALEMVCDRTLNYLEEGDPLERVLVDPEEELKPPNYALHPLMPLGMPTILYGDGGSGKSILAIGLSLTCLLPWEDNPFGLIPPPKPMRPLFLDWEMDPDTFRYRTQLYLRGHNLPAVEMLYRRCSLPLVAELEHLQDLIADNGVNLLIVDSLGAATGGDLNLTEGPLAFFQALRQLNVTALIVAHTSKDKEADRGVYGNVHFRNYARSVWECRKQQEFGGHDLRIGLLHRKANISEEFKARGLCLAFSTDSLVVSQIDPTSIADVLERMGLKAQILTLLKTKPLSVSTIQEAVGKKRASQVSPRLSELKRANQVTHLADGSWGLASHLPPEQFR